MAKRPPPKRKKRDARKLSPAARKPLAEMYSEILFGLIYGMVKAESVESAFAKIREDARNLTKDQMRRMSDLAGEFFAERANPSDRRLSPEEIEALKKEAFEFALKQMENEKKN